MDMSQKERQLFENANDKRLIYQLKRMNSQERSQRAQEIGSSKLEQLCRLDPQLGELCQTDGSTFPDNSRTAMVMSRVSSSTTASSTVEAQSEAFREMSRNAASLKSKLRAATEQPVPRKRYVHEAEMNLQAMRRQERGLEGELRLREDSEEDEGEPSKKFKRYYYEDVDERRYLVYDRVEAIKSGADSLFVRRMTNLDRLKKVMSGEGLRLCEDKFREVLTGRMTEELLGIGKEDPTFVSNLELRRVLVLPVMRDQSKFGKLLRGTLHSLSDFVIGGRIEDLTQLEQACLGVQNVFAAVFDLRWNRCMETVLMVIRDAVMRQVTLKFVLVRVEGAWRYFNRIVVGPDRYEKNPVELSHPEELIRIESVIQLAMVVDSEWTTRTMSRPSSPNSMVLRVWWWTGSRPRIG